jgi:hypothetical protein
MNIKKPKYSLFEKGLISIINKEKKFIHNNKQFTILIFGKPTAIKGEPKTDIYILAKSADNEVIEFKILVRQDNANFLENKISIDRMKSIFKNKWETKINNLLIKMETRLKEKPLIYKEKFRSTQKGSILLGYRLDILNIKSGVLSDTLDVTKEELLDIYTGITLEVDKKNAYVNGHRIENSGIANSILNGYMQDYVTLQDIIDNIECVKNYIIQYPNVFFALKGLNYRTFKQGKKWDGDRTLSVYIEWFVENNQLKYEIILNNPLLVKGNQVALNLKNSLKNLNIKDTNDININNTLNYENIVFDI